MAIGLLAEPVVTYAAESTTEMSDPAERRPAGSGNSGNSNSSSPGGRRPSTTTPTTPRSNNQNNNRPPQQNNNGGGRRPSGNRNEPSSRNHNDYGRSYSNPPRDNGGDRGRSYYAPAPHSRGHRPPPPPYYGGSYGYGYTGGVYYSDYNDGYAYGSSLDNYFGIRVGLNLASVRSEAPELNGTSMKPGLNLGIVYGQQIVPTTPLYFETGLFYTQKGGKSDYAGYGGLEKSKFTYNLDYLEIPFVLKYIYWANPSSRVSIEPYVGGFVSVGVAGNIKDYGERQAFSSYDDNYFKRADAGVKVGCGLGFGLGYLDVSYDIGLNNVGKDVFDDTRTGCLTVNLGVNF